ncbi:hypothetical protein HM1_3005 [Heliomicrobium modesticaldum Ice1]|uniref:DUF4391 domain-containing protein n=1 Tax=Heliobacterium modesticaldum (strain ATCC 51547 / Ice1) TaxID=498761 RepID=B0TDI9_HELMI|nr:DUF4391 domain-containing protein [Heliomicrobium modesticaldum]ABZ85514.1 hypothetical protein HM1_3005 [Heliomicrobium modesticaldum Ice1]
MLAIPDAYRIEKTFALKTFLTSDVTPAEKKRLKENVQEVRLSYQIAGEAIPSLIDDEYDCQAILFFTVRLSDLKHAPFTGTLFQRLVKPLCVIRFYDHSQHQLFCFAHKRLNRQDRTQIVLEDMLCSAATSMRFADEVSRLMEEHIFFDKIGNRGNKLDYYLEMMGKAFIISNLSLWSGMKGLLHSKAWYNREKTLHLYRCLKETQQKKNELKSARTVAEQAQINGELKRLYARLNDIIETT